MTKVPVTRLRDEESIKNTIRKKHKIINYGLIELHFNNKSIKLNKIKIDEFKL